jgi:UDP-N-acetylmuramate--alanine ligase
MQEALATFQGVGRRFTVRGRGHLPGRRDEAPVTVVDDYGHHPAEIRATLAGTRAGFPDHRLVAVFQPHRYTRTRDLLPDFARAFDDAEVVVVTDVYAAGEEPIAGATSAALVERLREHGHPDVRHVARRSEVAVALLPQLHPGDLVITFGAGDVWQCGDELVRQLDPIR